MRRQVPLKPIAILTTTTTLLLTLFLLSACCCVKGPLAPVSGPPQIVIPAIGTEPIPTPSEVASKAPTQALMRNVWFHIDQDAYLDIHFMRGELVSKTVGAPLNLDNKLSFVMKVDTAKIGMRSASLDVLMNRYIFGYANPRFATYTSSHQGSSSSRAASSTRSSTSPSRCGRTCRRRTASFASIRRRSPSAA